MWTHDEELPPSERRPAASDKGKEDQAFVERAVADGRPGSLDAASVLRLQRAAGNASVSSLLAEDEERSPVLDMVGSGGGQPLDEATRTEMEPAFGQDFSDVRIHTGAKASESAKSVQALAYTVGSDIVFQDGRYAPHTDAGRHTLAHELAHVVQQRSGPVEGTPATGGVSISHPSDRFEQAAERAATEVVTQQHTSARSGITQAPVQRQDADSSGEDLSIQRQTTKEEDEEEEIPDEERLKT